MNAKEVIVELVVGLTQVLLVKEVAMNVVLDEVSKGAGARQAEGEGFP